MIAILLLALASEAPPLFPSSSDPSTSNNEDSAIDAEFQPKIAVVIGILAALLCLTFFLVVYGRHCKSRSQQSSASSTANTPTGVIIDQASIPHRHHHHYRHLPAMRLAYDSAGNLSQWIIDALPKLRSSQVIFEKCAEKREIDCPVCLSRYEDGDLLRLLPRCGHSFHLACVDKWLLSSPSCPVCRAGVSSHDIVELENYLVHRVPKVEPSPPGEANDIEVIVESEPGVPGGRLSSENNKLRRSSSLNSLVSS